MQQTLFTVSKVFLRHMARNMDFGGPEGVPDRNPPQEQHSRPATYSPPSSSKVDMPTTAETVTELKRRLGKELYRAELDLQNGGRIAGKPCDCLSRAKHSAGIEATAEELMSYEVNPLYGEVIEWFNSHAREFEPAEIAKRPPEYYQGLTPEIRNFRKKVMGTENVMALTREGA